MGTPVTTYAADYKYDAFIGGSASTYRLRGVTLAKQDEFDFDVQGNERNAFKRDDQLWSDSNQRVASTDTKGTVTANSIGMGTITLKHPDYPNIVVDTVTVTVVEDNSDELANYNGGLTIYDDENGQKMPSFTLLQGDEFQLYAEGGDVSWSSSEGDVATVSDGLIKAIAKGSTKITATQGTNSGTLMVSVLPTPEPETTPEPEKTPKPEEKPKQEETPEPKQSRNPKTGDATAAMTVTYFGSVLVMALGVMLRLVKNKRQFEM